MSASGYESSIVQLDVLMSNVKFDVDVLMANEKRTSCRPVWYVIILVINKSDSRFAFVRFCQSLDYKPNWTPVSLITIIYSLFLSFGVSLIRGLSFSLLTPSLQFVSIMMVLIPMHSSCYV